MDMELIVQSIFSYGKQKEHSINQSKARIPQLLGELESKWGSNRLGTRDGYLTSQSFVSMRTYGIRVTYEYQSSLSVYSFVSAPKQNKCLCFVYKNGIITKKRGGNRVHP